MTEPVSQTELLKRIRRMLATVQAKDRRITDLAVEIPVVDVTPEDAEASAYAATGVEVWTITTEPFEGPVRFTKQERPGDRT